MKYLISVIYITFLSINIIYGDTLQHKYDKIFEGIDFIYFLKFDSISYLDTINLSDNYTFPSVLHLSSSNNIVDQDNFKKLDSCLYLFFTAKEDLISYLLTFEDDDSTLYTGFYKLLTANRSFDLSSSSPFSKNDNYFEDIILEKRYIALTLLVNYSINKLKEDYNIRILMVDEFEISDSTNKSVISWMYSKYKEIYNTYHEGDIREFHKQVVDFFNIFIKKSHNFDYNQLK